MLHPGAVLAWIVFRCRSVRLEEHCRHSLCLRRQDSASQVSGAGAISIHIIGFSLPDASFRRLGFPFHTASVSCITLRNSKASTRFASRQSFPGRGSRGCGTIRSTLPQHPDKSPFPPLHKLKLLLLPSIHMRKRIIGVEPVPIGSDRNSASSQIFMYILIEKTISVRLEESRSTSTQSPLLVFRRSRLPAFGSNLVGQDACRCRGHLQNRSGSRVAPATLA